MSRSDFIRVFAAIGIGFAMAQVSIGNVRAETMQIGIGTQDTTTNTVNSGAVVREMHLLEKYLPKTGRYANTKFEIEWQNYTSGPPITNSMIANKLQFGSMGDYPATVNGYTFSTNPESHGYMIGVTAYNINGAGNGIVVHKDSPYYEIGDLKGKIITVPFGSAGHGMVLKAMQDHGWKEDFWQLANQAPEVGSTNLQEKKIDAHADFVPFAELLPYRGFARKIFDGVETKSPTFHSMLVRQDFADKNPEIVVAYIKATIEATNWIKSDPKRAAEKIEEWTKINKEVVYMFLGPGGIMTMNPTIKPELIQADKTAAEVLRKLDRMKEFDIDKWVNDRFLRQAYSDLGLDYEKDLKNYDNYEVTGTDAFCNKPIDAPRRAGQIWIKGGDIVSFSSPRCALAALADLKKKGQEAGVVFLYDAALGIKLFANQAFYAIKPGTAAEITPFLLKKDAEAEAQKAGGKVGTFEDALAAVTGS